MRNWNGFVLVRNEKDNTIDEYMINFNQEELNNYTKKLVDENGNDLVIKKMLETRYLKTYSDTKGVLSPNKLEYLINYIHNDQGVNLYQPAQKYIIDYDSHLSIDKKKQIILDYLKLLEFVLINSQDLDIVNQAYDIFNSFSTAGISQAFNGTEKIIQISSNANKLFTDVEFNIEEKAKVLTKI